MNHCLTMKNNKIAIIGTVGVPANYGGFETLVENLIGRDSINYTVYCSAKNYKNKPKTYKNANLVYLPFNANGKSSVIYDLTSIIHSLFSRHDILLILGISGAIFIPFVRLFFPKKKIIINLDGIEWKREKWNGVAKNFLQYSERIAVRNSHVLVADNLAISNYIKEVYKKDSVVIEYGGDHALSEKEIASDKLPFNVYSLSICRIEPENNIHLILKAFEESNNNLIFIGNWDSSKYGVDLRKEFADYKNILMLNPIYEFDKLNKFRQSCDIYIHGHSAGGTNPSLVEMMHFGKPIYAYDCDYNKETMDYYGKYFSSSHELRDLINKKIDLNDGSILKQIANKKYTWDIIYEKYKKLFI
tara:strand:- start:11957 stop:13033 length:1077 start_codon:yes stop_codon:yes gene_type:complete